MPTTNIHIESPCWDKLTCDAQENWLAQSLERPPSFGHHSDIDLFCTWSLGPVIRTRDSGILETANYKALKAALKAGPFVDYDDADDPDAADFAVFAARHWAVGWVDHLSFRVTDENGEASPIARWIYDWYAALSDYPVADEDLYSELEYEALQESLASLVRDTVRSSRHRGSDVCLGWLEDDAVDRLIAHVAQNNEVYAIDDHGGIPLDSDDVMRSIQALWPGRCEEYATACEGSSTSTPDSPWIDGGAAGWGRSPCSRSI